MSPATSASRKAKKGPKPKPVSQRKVKRQKEEDELADLENRTQDPVGRTFIRRTDALQEIYTSNPDLKTFDELPLSRLTAEGLKKANYVEMTDIQKGSLPYSLCGRDVLGAARTGSGKTLAFLIPVLEKLFRAKWTAYDGVGAIIISPTRELAVQIFEVLRKVGRNHSFSAGLLIGGKDLVSEQERVGRMNILVCTPGRLLQHMDQTPDFSCDNLQVLGKYILDEADRILDSGFATTLNAIVENLPKSRQTLLFSATQTKSVKDLARLSLKDPEYIAVHEDAETATPKLLVQRYIVLELQQKLDMLYSFIKTHLKCKTLVFLSSCKQVRFVFETFCKLQPGVPLMCLHGKQKQQKRLTIFEDFCRKTHVCLFATDVAARGLDFPAVDWVVQVDCPEDAATYIHRVGRTARYDAKGNALLFMLPSEKDGMLEALQAKKIPIEEIKVNPKKLKSVQQKMVMFCSKDPEIKYLGQKAFISYMKSVYLQSNKAIFKVDELPSEAFAESLGLPGAPRIKFLKKSDAKNAPRPKKKENDVIFSDEEDEDTPQQKKKQLKEVSSDAESLKDSDFNDDEMDESENEEKKPGKPVTRVDRMFAAKNKTILSDHYRKLLEEEGKDEDDENFFGLVRANHDVEDATENPPPKVHPAEMTKKQLLKAKQKELKARGKGKKLEFDEDGNLIENKLETLEEFVAKGSIEKRQAERLAMESMAIKEADVEDKELAKAKRREKRLKKKLKEKEDDFSGDEATAVLASDNEDNADYEGEEDGDEEDEFAEYDNYVAGDDESDDGDEDFEGGDALDIDLDEDFDEYHPQLDEEDEDDEYIPAPPKKDKKNKRTAPVEDEDVPAPVRGKKSKKRKLLDSLSDGATLEDLASKLLASTAK
ncbi:ATP-dependent RNA helicase dbp4 [Phlyctochytrium bullatum]|nr:ATP-dependent RNA helicase dbp4 [Phlyctochytrium bullatum]